MKFHIHIHNFHADTKVQIDLQKGEKCNFREAEESHAMCRLVPRARCAHSFPEKVEYANSIEGTRSELS